MAKITPNYMELRADDIHVTKHFYEKALGFAFTDYGPEYVCVEDGPAAVGFAKGDEPKVPLPTFESDDLESSLASVIAAGGKIVQPIFSFPGGRRFHFTDPSGNEIAVFQSDPV